MLRSTNILVTATTLLLAGSADCVAFAQTSSERGPPSAVSTQPSSKVESFRSRLQDQQKTLESYGAKISGLVDRLKAMSVYSSREPFRQGHYVYYTLAREAPSLCRRCEVGSVANQEPRNQHDRSAHAESKTKEKTNKTTNVGAEMLQVWQTESIVVPGDFVRHPWIVGMDTVSRGMCRGE
jgi:hypothetical protein